MHHHFGRQSDHRASPCRGQRFSYRSQFAGFTKLHPRILLETPKNWRDRIPWRLSITPAYSITSPATNGLPFIWLSSVLFPLVTTALSTFSSAPTLASQTTC